MRLGSHEIRMLRQFEDLHNGLARSFARKNKACFFECFDISRRDFVAMSEAHPDGVCLREQLPGKSIGFKLDIEAAKAHISAKAFDF